MDHKELMRMAIHKAEEGTRNGQTPFGACIAINGEVLSCTHNEVWKTNDVTAHAEVCAVRVACRKIGSIDLSLATIYSTCEPCPMCFSACHWARIKKIFYAAGIEDAKKYGFNEMLVSNENMKCISESDVEITGRFLREESLAVFEKWNKMKAKQTY